MSNHGRPESVRTVVLAIAALLAADRASIAQDNNSTWAPGAEVRVVDSDAGVDGYYPVYVPVDYDPDELWPVVFYYHGLGGRPSTRTIRRIAMGRGCIVVGMSYYAAGMAGYEHLETEDVRILRRVRAAVSKRLNVNDDRLYVAGFSKGGFYTCEMLRLLPGMFAGAVVFGAGSKSLDDWPDMRGKEVFIGVGERDQFRQMAVATRDRLAERGAIVTFEQWPDVGHGIGDPAGVRRWLFEQTIDRPRRAGGDAQGPSSPSASAARSGPCHGWTIAAIAALAVGMAAAVLFVRRRGAPPRSGAGTQDG